MRGPVVETILLLLLVVFFGIQQRSRPQLYFRIWTVGWILVFLSLTVWDTNLSGSAGWVLRAQDAVRYDFILLAGLAFAISPVLTRDRLLRMTVRLAMLTLPMLVGLGLQRADTGFTPGIHLIELILVVGSEVGGVGLVLWAMPRAWSVRKACIASICAASAVWVLVTLLRDPGADVGDIVLAQVFLCAAVHYLGAYGRTHAGLLGGVGFTMWGLFYLLPDRMLHGAWAMQMFYEFWNVPKYFVGFSMALRVLEVEGEEKAQLVSQFQVLYQDFKGLYESHPHPVWILDGAADRMLSVNTAAQENYGFTQEEFLALRPADLESGWDEDVDAVDRMLPAPVVGRRVRHKRKDGDLIWMNIEERPIVFQGREARMVLARDVTERLRMNRQLAFQAHHDPLTGLANRSLLGERLQQCLATALRDGRRAAVLAIDVDYFKRVNDVHGHMVGDACLKAVAARLQSRIRQSDTLARTGGEEFVAAIGQLQQVEDAHKVAMSLLRQFDEVLNLESCELRVTVSIGVALYPDDGMQADELQRRADAALYEAKRRGRAQVVMAREIVSELEHFSR